MANSNVTIPIRSVTKDLTMNVSVSGLKIFSIRLRIGQALLWLAAKVMGIGSVSVKLEK